jgi:hypothetical protein
MGNQSPSTTRAPGVCPVTNFPTKLDRAKLAMLQSAGGLWLDPIIGNVDRVDIRNTAAHVDGVLGAVGTYVNAVVADLAGRCTDGDDGLPAIDVGAIARALDNMKIFIVGEISRPAGEG